MRIGLVFGVVLFASVGACADVNSCISRDGADQTPCVAGPVQYINAATTGPVDGGRVVPVNIDRNFNLYERAKIQRAINEWNFVLNGQIRLDVAEDFQNGRHMPAPSRGDSIMVSKVDSSSPMIKSHAFQRTLALTVGTRKAIVFVVADRLGSRDLGGIMMHEFGHALGAGHDPGSALMHPYYTGDKQRCIDKGAARAVATAQNLPLDRFNWCGAGAEHHHVNVAETPASRRGERRR